MKRLGPRKVTSILVKVYDVNGNITADIGKVINGWKLGLLNRPGELGFENYFHEKCINDKVNIEWDMENEYFISNPQLNLRISMDEIKSYIGKLQGNKATGVDNIPNFVLKNSDVLHMLHQLFSKLFESCILLSLWLKSVINPIPKGSNKDPYIPLNYRGMSLLSCVKSFFQETLITVLLTTVKIIIYMRMNKMDLDIRDLVKIIFIH